ncbi:MAG: urate hydroxylase PuuD [Ignavibacteriae bacterium]|nr:urate hydroxylase PuuD [Ignavibacteriota bacterium]
MEFDLMEWIHLGVRWMHVFAAILWIGTTYFFTWLDARFSALMKKNDGEKNVWMVHSGGFYVVEKQKSPASTPATLHWFKWESALTWMSGIFLLGYLYYYGGLLVDETMSERTAMIVGIATIILSWPVYDFLWKTSLAKNEFVAAALSYALIVACAYGLLQYMAPRAAYMHVGALFGTLMTANVWQVIIPAQRKMVAALTAQQPVDTSLGERAKTRSKHNTYMVMPVVFIMISNHFPTITYGSSANWIAVALLIAVGWGVAMRVRRA